MLGGVGTAFACGCGQPLSAEPGALSAWCPRCGEFVPAPAHSDVYVEPAVDEAPRAAYAPAPASAYAPPPPVDFYCQCGARLSVPMGTPSTQCARCGAVVAAPMPAFVHTPPYGTPLPFPAPHAAPYAAPYATPPHGSPRPSTAPGIAPHYVSPVWTEPPSRALCKIGGILAQLTSLTCLLIGLLGMAVGAEVAKLSEGAAGGGIIEQSGLWCLLALGGIVAGGLAYRGSVFGCIASGLLQVVYAALFFYVHSKVEFAAQMGGTLADIVGALFAEAFFAALAALFCFLGIAQANAWQTYREQIAQRVQAGLSRAY